MKPVWPAGLFAGDKLVNKVTVKTDRGSEEKTAYDRIPVDYKLIVSLASKDETGDGIAETGELVHYTITIKNPSGDPVLVYETNDLTQQEHETPLLGNILKYAEIIGDPVVTGHHDQNDGNKVTKIEKGEGISGLQTAYDKYSEKDEEDIKRDGEEKLPDDRAIFGKVLVPPMGEEDKKVEIKFTIKIYENLSEEVEAAIEESIKAGRPGADQDGAYIYDTALFFEQRHEAATMPETDSGETETGLARYILTAEDPDPPLLMPIERNQVLYITKDVNKDEVSVGDLVAYEITLENRKPDGGKVSHIFVEDKLPTGFRYVKGTARFYRKDDSGKYKKEKIEPVLNGRVMKFDVGDLAGNEKIHITYILRVGTGVTPNTYENLAVALNKKDEPISNTAKALVQVVLDRLFDMSTIIGKVFHDRDGDGWQDDANAYDVKLKTLTHQDNYENLDGFYVNAKDKYWLYTRIKKGELGDIFGRETKDEEIPKLILRRRIKDPHKISQLQITTANGLTLTLEENGKVTRKEKGLLKKGESGEILRAKRKIVEVYGIYYEQLELYNLGIHEEGIPGVKLSTVDGLVVTTDRYGRYHIEEIPIESVRGNTFIIKADPVTLPKGSRFTTPNPLLKRIYHVMEKYNFGVQYPDDKEYNTKSR